MSSILQIGETTEDFLRTLLLHIPTSRAHPTQNLFLASSASLFTLHNTAVALVLVLNATLRPRFKTKAENTF